MPLPVSSTSCLEKVQDRGSGGFGACGAKEEDKGNGRVSVFGLMLGTTVGKKKPLGQLFREAVSLA